MIIEGMASDRRNLFWTLFHVLLGFLCTLTPVFLIVWFYLFFLINIGKGLNLLSNKKPDLFLMLFSYLISFEVLDRMAKTSPFLPYELGKYLLVFMGILGLLNLGVRSSVGIFMVFLILPALLYDFSKQRVLSDIINYLLAPLAVGLGIAFTYKFRISLNNLHVILKFIFWGCLASLVFTFIKTPDLDDISFSLKANFETTAGHSSNQVSTVLGLGMFLAFYSLYRNLSFAGNKILDITALLGFTFQGLLSFSRGGMMVGVLGIILLIIIPEKRKLNRDSFNVTKSGTGIMIGLVSVIAIYSVFEIANSVTDGNLLLRYKGETQGTLLGSKEITADHFVTGRLSIFQQDLELFYKYPFTGVGLGSSRYIRDKDRIGVAPHVELSRLIAEHGLLGLIFAIMFFRIPWISWKYNRNVTLLILLIIAEINNVPCCNEDFRNPFVYNHRNIAD